MKIKKCLKCGAVVNVFHDCTCSDCGIKCCEDSMITLKANSSDGDMEKHVPIYEVVGNIIEVSVNHVMDEEHHIEWIAMENEDMLIKINVKDKAFATFPYIKGSKLYSYCNKHGLFSKDVI